ncbi:MAG: hypothetical protein ACK4UJ_09970 [Leptonema sp. (in: bacteria)]
MNQPSRKKILLSWLLEGIFLFLQLLTLFLFIPLPNSKKGNKNAFVIITDVITSPILYIVLYLYLIKNQYRVYFYYSFNPLKNLNSHSLRLSRFLINIPEQNLTLLGHGAGGLVPLSISDEARKKVKKLITLGTGYWGTQLFKYFDFIPLFRDLLPRSEYLTTYKMNALLYEEFYPFTPWFDEWIFPDTLLKFGQGRDIILDIPGRLNLILNLENIKTYLQFFNQIHNTKLEKFPTKKIQNRNKEKKQKKIQKGL